MTTTTARIGGLRWLYAEATTALFGPDHSGVDDRWLTELRGAPVTSQPGNTDTALIPTIRARAAITAEPHRLVHDEHLGDLWIAGQVPAHTYNAMTGGAR